MVVTAKSFLMAIIMPMHGVVEAEHEKIMMENPVAVQVAHLVVALVMGLPSCILKIVLCPKCQLAKPSVISEDLHGIGNQVVVVVVLVVLVVMMIMGLVEVVNCGT